LLESLLILLVAQAGAPASAPGVAQEIVVIGRKLDRWTASYVVRGNTIGCRTKISTGDREIDAIGCASFEACVGQLRERINESDRKDLEEATRKTMKGAIKRDLAACVRIRRDALIADLADRRFTARNPGGD
jgi:hypothetical protein